MYNLFYDETYSVCYIYGKTHNEIYTESSWVELSTYDDFVNCILTKGLPYLMSIGHDVVDNAQDSSYYQEKIKSGYDCILWLDKYCKDNNLTFPKYIIHTDNKNSSIKSLLKSLNL